MQILFAPKNREAILLKSAKRFFMNSIKAKRISKAAENAALEILSFAKKQEACFYTAEWEL